MDAPIERPTELGPLVPFRRGKFDDLPETPWRPHRFADTHVARLPITTAELGACTAAVRTYGHGPPLLLVHGLMTTSYSWRYVLASLGAHFTLYMPDLPGNGDSDRPQQRAYHPEALASWLGAGMVGTPARIVGYGQAAVGVPSSTRRQATTVIAGLDADDTVRVGDPQHVTCLGDSGGPALIMEGGAEIVIGVDSYADNGSCNLPAHFRRTDLYTGFLDPYLGTAANPDAGVDAGVGADAGVDPGDDSGGCAAGGGAGAGGALVVAIALALVRRRRR